MPKINFNVPLVTETGEAVKQPKAVNNKIKPDAKGQAVQQFVTDAEGNAIMEDVQVKDILVRVLASPFPGDEALSFSDRAKRGKLARKIATSSSANYRTEELAIIQELSARAASTTLLAQLDDLINGEDKVDEEAA